MDLGQLKGCWALVTGASTGIGRAFAVALAAVGLNLVLVARREALLNSLSLELHASHGVETRVLPLDLAEPDSPERLRATLEQAGIGLRVVVNNAGAWYWGPFDGWPLQDYLSMLRLNVEAPLALCHLFLPELASRAPSAIINVSSPAALQPVPFLVAYAATKAFVHSFSLALYGEWRGRGVYVQTLVPGPTATEFAANADAYPSKLAKRRAPPSVIVAASLRALAKEAPVAVAGHGTFAQRVFVALAPPRYLVAVVGKMFRPPGERS